MACAFQQLNFQKCAENGVLLPFWLPNVLPATTACTFSAPQLPKELWTWQFFNRFDFEICFAPQQPALFQQLNFQKWSKNGVFFNILTSNYASKCAFAEPDSFSRFWFRNVATRRFGEPTFRSFRAPKHWENKVFRDFSSFLRSCIFFLLTLSLFSASFFCLSLTALFPPLLFICLHCRKSEF